MTTAKRPTRTTRSSRRRLTPAQRREIRGVILIGLGLLGVVSMLPLGGGPMLDGLRSTVTGTFGYGWPLALISAIAGGVFMIWPKAPSIPRAQLAAATVATLALLGLLSLAAAPAGGAIGRAVLRLAAPAGLLGRLLLLVLALVVATLAAVPVGPGRSLQAAVSAARSVYAHRQRLAVLVRLLGALHGLANRIRVPQVSDQGEPTRSSTVGAVPARNLPRAGEGDEREVGISGAGPDEEGPADRGGEEAGDEPASAWALPALSLLDPIATQPERAQAEIQRTGKLIVSTLATFGVEAKVIRANSGPAVTQYELQPAAGVQVRKVVSLQNDLSMALAAASLRIEAPIPGKSAIGIEVPNKRASLVTIREVVESPAFQDANHVLGVALGSDVAGRPVAGDLTRMPHLLISGATNQGKSVEINTLLCSLLLQHGPDRLQLILVDPKRVELQSYEGLPHLVLPVIVEPQQAAAALRWAVAEMERRFKLLAEDGVRNIAVLNAKATAADERPLPYQVIVIDELADLMMMAAGEVEELICRLAQKARAVGIHLVIATQRPSTDVITGLIKANVPSRIAFAVGSQVDSRVILDQVGAEKLLGRGDMLYLPVDASRPQRLQGAYTSDREIEALVGWWREQGEPHFLEGVLNGSAPAAVDQATGPKSLDPLFARAARAVAAEGAASISLVQRKFNVGYSRAGRIVDQLAEQQVIGAYQGSKSREVLMGLPEVDELVERIGLEGKGDA